MRIKLGIPLRLKEIADAVSGISDKDEAIEIKYLTTNSKEVEKGDLFIALDGKDASGESFVNEAICRGATPLCRARCDGCISVESTRSTLLSLASYYKNKLTHLRYTVAITGSVGKTTTKEFLKVISSVKYKVHSTKGNFNNDIGMPLSILTAEEDTEILILEMGMNARGEISALSKCAKPDIAIITNVGTSHIGKLGSRSEIAKAKLEILDGLGEHPLIIPYGEPQLPKRPGDISFSIWDHKADLTVKRIEEAHGEVNIRFRDEELLCSFSPLGKHNLLCLAPAVAAGMLAGLSNQEIKMGISSISNENIRQSVIFCNNFYILADYYNSSYESVIADADMIFELSGYNGCSALIGSILELGEYAEEIHYSLGARLSKYRFQNLYFIGEYADALSRGAIEAGFDSSRVFKNPSSDTPMATAKDIIHNTHSGEIILFKASHAVRLERVYEILKSLV